MASVKTKIGDERYGHRVSTNAEIGRDWSSIASVMLDLRRKCHIFHCLYKSQLYSKWFIFFSNVSSSDDKMLVKSDLVADHTGY